MEDFGTEGAEINEVYQKALANPENYVMKPQKEGGGNNLYFDAIRKKLLEVDNPELKTYQLMDRIRPPLVRSYKAVYGKVKEVLGFTEFGICSSIIAELKDGEITIHDEMIAGMFFKNKDSNVAEAEICKGTGTVDYPLLVPISTLAEKAKGQPKGQLVPTILI